MASVTWASDRLSVGVSRKPTKYRDLGYAQDQDNCFSSTRDGLRKRHPLDWWIDCDVNVNGTRMMAGSPNCYILDFGVKERYLVVQGYRFFHVYDLNTREKVNVYNQAGTLESNFDYLAGLKTSSHSKDIVDQKTPEDLSNNMGATEESPTEPAPDVTKSWKAQSTKTGGAGTMSTEYFSTSPGAGGTGPYVGKVGSQVLRVSKTDVTTVGNALHYYRFVQADEGGIGSSHNKFPRAGMWTRWQAIIPKAADGGNPSPSFGLTIFDATNNQHHRAQWNYAGGLLNLTPAVTVGSVVATAVDLRNGFMLLRIAHRTTQAEATSAERRVGFYWDINDNVPDRRVTVQSVLLEDGFSASWGDRYRKPAEQYRGLAIQSTLLIANTDTTVTMDTTAAPAKSPAEEVYFWVKNATSSAKYKIRLKAGGAKCKVGSIIYMSAIAGDPDEADVNKGGAECIGFTPGDWGAVMSPANCECAGAGTLNDTKKGVWVDAGGTPNQGTRRIKSPNTDDVALDLALKDDETTFAWGGTAGTSIYYPSGNKQGDGLGGTVNGANGTGNHGLKYFLTVANALKPFDATTITWPNNGSNTVEVVGSMIRVTSPTLFDEVEVWDSFGGEGLRAIRRNMERETELPLHGPFQDGFRVRIQRDTKEQIDDYFLKFTADAAGTFGVGKWDEGTDYGVLTRLKKETMPHQLIRKFDNSAGTVTGVPLKVYFEYGPFKRADTGATWDDRLVGDDTLNKQPSFVGKKVAGMALWQGRLALMTSDSVVLSETNRYSNFWQNSCAGTVADDRIDLTPDKGNAYPFTQMLVGGSSLLLWDGHDVTTLSPPDGVVSALDPPRMRQPFALDSVEDAVPVKLGDSVFFVNRVGDQTSVVHELYPSPEGGSIAHRDVTDWIPRYIDGKILQIASSQTAGCLSFVTDTNNRYWYMFRVAGPPGAREQEAWWRNDSGAGHEVLCQAWVADDCFMVIRRQYAVSIERMRVVPRQVDSPATWLCHLDRRVNEDTPGYSKSVSGGNTTIRLPYKLDDGETPSVVDRTTGAPATVNSIGSIGNFSTLQLNAIDLTNTDLWVGIPYLSRWVASPPLLGVDPRAGKAAVTAGLLSIHNVLVSYESTYAFTGKVSIRGGTEDADPYVAPSYVDDVVGASQPTLDSGTKSCTIAGDAEISQFAIESSDHRPFAIVKLEWEGEYEPAGSRAG